MKYNEVLEIATKLNAKLLATDSGFNNSVIVLHDEGTVISLENSFATKLEDWYIVFSEHHGFSIYQKDDLFDIIMRGPRLPIKELNIENL